MATTVTVPATTGDSRIHRIWMWTRALMAKAKMTFVQGATKVRALITRVYASTGAAVATAGVQIGLATKSGWNAGSTLLTKGVGKVAKGALGIARLGSWVGSKIMGLFGWGLGLFSKRAGKAIARKQKQFDQWRGRQIEAAKAKVEMATFAAHAAITSQTAQTVGRATAGVLGLGAIANLATGGAVAAKAAALPLIGKLAGLAFGPVGLLITGGVALLGGLFAWAFKRREVNSRVKEIQTEMVKKAIKEAKAKQKAQFKAELKKAKKAALKEAKKAQKAPQQPVVVAAPPVAPPAPAPSPAMFDVDIRDGVATITSNHPDAQEVLTPEKTAELMDAAKIAHINEAGFLRVPPRAMEEITDEIVLASFKTHKARPKGEGGIYTDEQMEKRRKALFMGYIAMPPLNSDTPAPVG